MSRPGLMMLAALAVGCQAAQPPVPVVGDVAALAGEWRGEYWSTESGRRGTILFSLQAGQDTAHGEVVMYPSRVATPLPTPAEPEPVIVHANPEPLAITFVRAGGGMVSGRLEPYRDPECGCRLTTTFTGRWETDTLAGTYVSVHESGRRVTGEWRVSRVTPTGRF